MEAGYRGSKATWKDAVKMVAMVQLSDITKESEEMQRGVEREAYEELKEMYGEGISFPQGSTTTTPICIVIFVPLTMGNLSAKDVIGDKKKMRRTQEIS